MKILIIEDEPLAAEDLAFEITALSSQNEILRVVSSIKEAVQYLQTSPPIDLIFSDIELGDGQCFEIFSKIPPPVPVIFCTAYNQYAIQAFKTNGIEYILKPFQTDQIAAAIAKYDRLRTQLKAETLLSGELIRQLFPQNQATENAVLVYHKDKIFPVCYTDIALFFVKHEMTHLWSFENQSFSINQTMEELEQKAGRQFFRANRQYLVNRSAIPEVIQHFNRKLLLKLSVNFTDEIIISKEKSPHFLQWLMQTKTESKN